MKIRSNPIIIENNNFQSILIKVSFPISSQLGKGAFNELLPSLLIRSNKEYPDEDIFIQEKIKRYISEFSCGYQQYNHVTYFQFLILIPNPKIIKENILEPAIDFMFNTIYNPNATNKQFNASFFAHEKKRLEQRITNANKNINTYTRERIYQEIDDVGFLTNSAFNNIELLKQITNQEIYQYYEKNIKHNKPLVFIMGDVNHNEINNIFDKYNLVKDIEIKDDYYAFLSTPKKLKEIEEKSHFNQSLLAAVYHLKKVSAKDYINIDIIANLLASRSSNILHDYLRKQEGLIYASETKPISHSGILILRALTDRNSKEKALEQIKKAMATLKNEEFIKPLLENIVEQKRINILKNLDNKFAVLENQFTKLLNIYPNDEEEYEIYKNISAKEIAKIAERLELSLTYFLEGEK